MDSLSDEGTATTPFTEGVSSAAEEELVIDENASTVSLAPNLCVVLHLTVAVREGEECIRDFLDHLSSEESASSHQNFGAEADDDDSFSIS